MLTPRGHLYFGHIQPGPVIVVVSWLLLLMTGTDVTNSTLLAVAVFFGLESIGAAGGIKTAPGLLNFVLILKFILIAIVLKTVTLQAADSNLRAPRTTCEVMAVGFFALYLGSWLYRKTPKVRGLVRSVTDSQLYLSIVIIFSLACLGSSAIIITFQTSYVTDLAGGLWGVAHQLQAAASFCVIPAMYYVWSRQCKLFLAHPLVLTILCAEILIGLASTTKQGVMEPLLCYISVGAIRYGIRSKAIWGLVAVGGLAYVSIIYPYSQYVRSHGGRDGTLSERLEVIQEIFFNVSRDSDFRNMVDTEINSGETYLNRDALRPISRLAMIGEADRLIAATDDTQSYTGWETITNGIKLAVPSFLISDKPGSGGGNLLGHIVGELAPDDTSTQVSYGFMANFYNAFGLYGVFFGTVIFIWALYYVLVLWFAEPNLEEGPWGSSIWYLLLGMLFEHSLIEGPVGNSLPSFIALSAPAGLVVLSRWSLSVLVDFAPRPRHTR